MRYDTFDAEEFAAAVRAELAAGPLKREQTFIPEDAILVFGPPPQENPYRDSDTTAVGIQLEHCYGLRPVAYVPMRGETTWRWRRVKAKNH